MTYDDLLVGGKDEDHILGEIGSDTIIGGAGDDHLLGDRPYTKEFAKKYFRKEKESELWQLNKNLHGNDILMGNEGNDQIVGNGGDDRLYGGEDDDRLFGDNAKFKGQSEVTGELSGNDYLNGGTGNDYLWGGGGNDTLEGGLGKDYLDGGLGDDTYIYHRNDGMDTIKDLKGINTIQLKSLLPSDVSILYHSDEQDQEGDYLEVVLNEKNDNLEIEGIFIYAFEKGTLNLKPGTENIHIEFADGSRVPLTELAKQIHNGSDGDDTIAGDHANNSLTGGKGNDQLHGNDGNDQLDGEEGNDEIYGGLGKDLISGGEGNDQLYGGEGNDKLQGGMGNDHLFGGAGDDELKGGYGNNILDGGAGNDTLFSWFSSIYQFGKNDGQDVITGGLGITIQFKEGVLPENVSFAIKGDDLTFSLADSDDSITIKNFTSNAKKLEKIEFADGTSWSLDDITPQLYQATDEKDLITGTDLDEQLKGLAGNDTLLGKGGNDTLEGNQGNDHLYGHEGNDKLYGNEGDDKLYGKEGDDELYGGDGNDKLHDNEGNNELYGGDGNDELYGGKGDDLLEGGDGNDRLEGYQGNDTYIVGRNSGQDTIYLEDEYGKRDTKILRFKEGISQEDIIVERGKKNNKNNNNLLVKIKDTDTVVTVIDYFQEWKVHSYRHWSDNRLIVENEFRDSRFDRIEFADGSHWTVDDVFSKISQATDGDDVITGEDTDDIIKGLAGNDTLSGKAGNDTFEGGPGNDTIDGGTGKNTYIFGKGDGQDIITFSDRGNEPSLQTIQFKEGISADDIEIWQSDSAEITIKIKNTTDQIVLKGELDDKKAIVFTDGQKWDHEEVLKQLRIGYDHDQRITGSDEDETFDGKAGNDILDGRKGRNIFLFGRGDGQDEIHSRHFEQDDAHNIIRFKEGITPDDVIVERRYSETMGLVDMEYYDLLLKLKGSDDQLRLQSFFMGGNRMLDKAEFADGTEWSSDEIKQMVLQGSPNNDHLEGYYDSNDKINGFTGHDNLKGFSGDDVLDGGAGNDSLIGGEGSDTYIFGRGYGRDIISANSSGDSVETLQFKEGVAESDLAFWQQENDLFIGIKNTQDRVQINRFFVNDSNKIDLIKFADGSTLSLDDVDQFIKPSDKNNVLYGDRGNNEIDGLGGDDEIYGGEGSDTLKGGDGNDTLHAADSYHDRAPNTLIGGKGNDTLYGSYGEETYIYNLGDGQDRIIETSRNQVFGGLPTSDDKLVFGEGVSATDLSFIREGYDLAVYHKNGSDQITIQDWFVRYGGNAPAYFTIKSFEFADGSTLSDSQVESQLTTERPKPTRILSNSPKSETFTGQTGNDTYQFTAGDGQDTINNTTPTPDTDNDVLKLSGITKDKLWFKKEGDNLAVDVLGSDDQITISDWFAEESAQLDAIETESFVLSRAKVDSLVQAMAAFNDYETADGNMVAEVHTSLTPTLTAAWQAK
ncbi:calcium-binding protein [Spartinivicinus poritis]|uniref:Calcium-binding protein n=1 Tax=Spartinivicinus poritis TaxID=2994640 RepID=A0ABT5UCH5_9GAMM|nr:calcium-binding protein [Spartinivicinus sp. A2-2]MDE1464081.1 calcium-binding protein [Spartinivicinus sp. A2-2]